MSESVDKLIREGKPIIKRGLIEEKFVGDQMKLKTGQKFAEKELLIGKKQDGSPKYHKFDLVSEDENIVVEVKSGKGIVGEDNRNSAGISTCFHDCYLLSKIPAKRKILALTDKNMFEIFKKESDGVVEGIEILHFRMTL